MENALLLLEKLVKYVYSNTVFQLSGLFSYPNSKAIEVAQHCLNNRGCTVLQRLYLSTLKYKYQCTWPHPC